MWPHMATATVQGRPLLCGVGSAGRGGNDWSDRNGSIYFGLNLSTVAGSGEQ